MIYDLQKASLLKRVSAWILDMILLLVLITGVAFVLSGVLNFNHWNQTVTDGYERYEARFGVSLDITQEAYEALTEEQQAVYDEAFAALNADMELVHAYNMLVNVTLLIITFSVLLAYLGLEFAVPLLFGNGQTVGKKVFGIALMKRSGVKINAVSLFTRTVLGKYAIETMIPVLMIMMMLLDTIGIMGPAVVIGILLVQVVMVITSPTNGLIHDGLAQTVAVDMQSQMIFASEADLIAYNQRLHEEKVRNSPY